MSDIKKIENKPDVFEMIAETASPFVVCERCGATILGFDAKRRYGITLCDICYDD